MKYKANWEETKEKWANYWKQKNTGRPVMCVIARKPEIEEAAQRKEPADVCRSQGRHYCLPPELVCKTPEEKYLDPEKIVGRYRHFCETHEFLAESFPNMHVDFGPGCLAGYLGSDIKFNMDTIWLEECVEEWENHPPFTFDEENPWFQKHIELTKKCKELAGDDFYICVPDLMEGLDVLAALRGSFNMLYDVAEEPEVIEQRVKEVNNLYFSYYDRFYDLVKNEKDNGSAYMVFQIWGPGKTAKLQCDFGAMISPEHFCRFALEGLKRQAAGLDNVVYHLDGEDNIRHLDAILGIDGIDAIQWVPGDSGPDGTLEKWDMIYDKAIGAGKSIWVKVYSGEFEDWIKNADRLVQKYGSSSIFLHFPEMSLPQAEYLMEYAEKNWKDIEGTYNTKRKGEKV